MKKIYKLTIIATAALLLTGLAGSLSAQTMVYVATDGSGDGTSWATAAGSIQDAIEASGEGTEIWIKAGTYYVPGDTTFNLKEGVNLYGGFAGTETDLAQRTDFGRSGANETLLSGDIDKNGITDAGNANRVVYGLEITSATTLDGLTITGGYADASSDDGAGLRLSAGSPNITNCTIFDNWCGDNGAGFYIASASTPAFLNCFILKNHADDKGGGGYAATDCNATFINCVFANNSAVNDGAGVRIYKSSPTFMNCSFTRNALPGNGDGSAAEINNSASAPIFVNTVFWGNTESGATAEDITLTTDGTVTLTNCALEGTYTATGTTATALVDLSSTDPMFVNTSGTSGTTGYDAAANWDIQEGSVLVDKGTSYSAFFLDINSLARDAMPDIGAYEAAALSWDHMIEVAITGEGYVGPDPGYVATGSDLDFILFPEEGYAVSSLTYNSADVTGSLVDNGNSTFTYTATGVAADGNLQVEFGLTLAEYTISASAGANGSIDPTGDITVTELDETEFTITANTGFVLDAAKLNSVDVTGDVNDNGDGTYNYILKDVMANVALAVTFKEMVVNVVYIVEGGSGNGTSWASAAGDIQAAIDAASFGDEIWIAKGTFIVPADTSFALKSGVSLYGGFAGSESSIDDRKSFGMNEANETKLSADVDGNGFLTGGNAPRVIFGEFISNLTTISGFTISGGFSDVSGSNGAAMKLRASSPNILNCTFYDNYCDDGSALYLYRSGDAVSSPLVKDCFFFKGLANDDGGAVYNASGTEAQFVNCVFANNEAKDEGGAVRNFECSPSFINCTFVYNALPDSDPNGGGTYGPAIRNYQGSSPYMSTEPDFINCVFWGNVDGTSGVSYCISNTGAMATAGAFVNVINCAIMDSVSASSCTLIDTLNITSENPGFANVAGSAGYAGYDAAYDWALTEGARLIGEGTSSEEGVPTMDIMGVDRGDQIDIGAYEFDPTIGINSYLSAGFEMEVYPNPTNGQFHVRVEQGSIHEIVLFDMTGRQVYRYADPGSGLEFAINLEGHRGIFLLRVSKENGASSTRKVLIQ